MKNYVALDPAAGRPHKGDLVWSAGPHAPTVGAPIIEPTPEDGER